MNNYCVLHGYWQEDTAVMECPACVNHEPSTNVNIMGDEAYGQSAGLAIAKLLDLKPNKFGRYPTTWGSKTALGLYLSIQRVIAEGKP